MQWDSEVMVSYFSILGVWAVFFTTIVYNFSKNLIDAIPNEYNNQEKNSDVQNIRRFWIITNALVFSITIYSIYCLLVGFVVKLQGRNFCNSSMPGILVFLYGLLIAGGFILGLVKREVNFLVALGSIFSFIIPPLIITLRTFHNNCFDNASLWLLIFLAIYTLIWFCLSGAFAPVQSLWRLKFWSTNRTPLDKKRKSFSKRKCLKTLIKLLILLCKTIR